MTEFSRRSFMITAASSSLALFAGTGMAHADNIGRRVKIDARADEALQKLVNQNEAAKILAEKAEALLIFPRITEAGIVGVGGKRGQGVLRQGGHSLAYYRTTGLSFGLEAGFETHGYVIMFMTHDAAQNFAFGGDRVKLGAHGEMTVFRAGATAMADTQNIKSEIVAFIFDEKGAMLNLTIEGTVVNRMNI